MTDVGEKLVALKELKAEFNVGEAVERLAFELYRRATPAQGAARVKELWQWLPPGARRQWTEEAHEIIRIVIGMERSEA